MKPRIARNPGLTALALIAGIGVAHAQTVTDAQVDAALPKLDALAQSTIASGAVPGLAIAVVFHDKLVFLHGYGLREMGKPGTVDDDTVFQIASLSKPVSSAVVAAVVASGKISWDSRISDLDPGFRLMQAYPTAQLTIRDLFSHRSGLPGTAGDDLEAIGYGRTDILARLRLVAPSSSFRAGYSYSNFGLTEGAVAAARSTGMDWESLADTVLYAPLGMTKTSSRDDDFLTQSDRAELHVKVDGAWAAKVQRDPDAQAPAGGVSSTARDLAQWMRLELDNGSFDGHQLIAQAAIEPTHQPVIGRGNNPITGAPSFYALGWNVEYGRHGMTWGHAGAFSVGARSVATLFPQAGLGIVVLTNAFPTGVPEGISDSFGDLVFDGQVAKDWFKPWDDAYAGITGTANVAARAAYANPPNPASPALPNAAYVGHYANDYAGDAVIMEANGSLAVALGPNGGQHYPLRHFDRDIFLYYPDAEAPDVPYAARFSVDSEGHAASVTLDSLNDHGMGNFVRRDN